jgi:hypothetical protein
VNDADPIVRGVVSGNRVVEDWMRQAQHTARLLGDSTAGAGWADASGRMLKTASDVMTTWWSMFGVAPPGAPGMNGHESADQPPSAAASEKATGEEQQAQTTDQGYRNDPDRTGVPLFATIDVRSRQPVSVTIDMRQVAIADLRVLDLRPERGRARRIRGTTATLSSTEGLRVRLTVPDDQPPGTYHGVVVDRVHDRAVGTITVRVCVE